MIWEGRGEERRIKFLINLFLDFLSLSLTYRWAITIVHCNTFFLYKRWWWRRKGKNKPPIHHWMKWLFQHQHQRLPQNQQIYKTNMNLRTWDSFFVFLNVRTKTISTIIRLLWFRSGTKKKEKENWNWIIIQQIWCMWWWWQTMHDNRSNI